MSAQVFHTFQITGFNWNTEDQGKASLFYMFYLLQINIYTRMHACMRSLAHACMVSERTGTLEHVAHQPMVQVSGVPLNWGVWNNWAVTL